MEDRNMSKTNKDKKETQNLLKEIEDEQKTNDDLFSESGSTQATSNSKITTTNESYFSPHGNYFNNSLRITNNKDLKHSNSKIIEFIKKILSGNYRLLAFANLCVLVTSSIQAYIPRICGKIIDSYTNTENTGSDSSYMSVFLVMIVVSTFFAFCRGFLFEYLSEKVIFKLKFYFFTELIYNKITFFEETKSGELISRLVSDILIIRNGLSENICMFIRNSIQLVISLILIFYLNYSLALYMILFILPSVYIIFKIALKMKTLTKDYNQAAAEGVGVITENFNNIKIIKAYNAESYEINKYAEKGYEAFNFGKRRAFIHAVMLAVINIIAFGLILFVLSFGGKQVSEGTVTIGELSSFFIYSTTLSVALMSLSATVGQLITAKSTLEKLLDLVEKNNSEMFVLKEVNNNLDNSNSSLTDYSFLNDDSSDSKITKSNVYHYNKIVDFNTLINNDHIFSNNYLEEKVLRSYLTPKIVKPNKNKSNINRNNSKDATPLILLSNFEENEFVEKDCNHEHNLKLILQGDNYNLNSFIERKQNNCPLEFDSNIDKIEFKNVYFRYKKRKISISTNSENIKRYGNINNRNDQTDNNNLVFEDNRSTHSFENDRALVLSNINISIEKGMKVAIVGESGSGKSSLVSLLLKYYPVDSGEILVNDCDIDNYSFKSLRNLISYVQQEPAVLSGTILSNILFGIEQCTENEIEDALNTANCGFIKDKVLFPNGLKTVIGEKGVRLSGGQKQRICIARAILKNPKIFIFDEATTALDSASESLVQQAIDNVIKKKNCTALIISHRLSTIKNCDKIIVMKKGKIISEGTHEQLIKKLNHDQNNSAQSHFNNNQKESNHSNEREDGEYSHLRNNNEEDINEYLRIFSTQIEENRNN